MRPALHGVARQWPGMIDGFVELVAAASSRYWFIACASFCVRAGVMPTSHSLYECPTSGSTSENPARTLMARDIAEDREMLHAAVVSRMEFQRKMPSVGGIRDEAAAAIARTLAGGGVCGDVDQVVIKLE
jgi:hypothetical protein